MTGNDYLKLQGYSAEQWIVLNNEQATLLMECAGKVNNMFAITDRKVEAQLGKGFWLTNIKWMEKFTEVTRVDASEELQEVADKIDEAIPSSVPPAPKTAIAPPPTTQVAIVDFECSAFDNHEPLCKDQCEGCEKEELEEEELIRLQRIKERVALLNTINPMTKGVTHYECECGINIGHSIVESTNNEEFAEYVTTFRAEKLRRDQKSARFSQIPKDNIVVASVKPLEVLDPDSEKVIPAVIVGGVLSVEQDSDNDIVKELYNPNDKGVEQMKKKQEEIAADPGVETEEVEEVLEELKDMDVEKATIHTVVDTKKTPEQKKVIKELLSEEKIKGTKAPIVVGSDKDKANFALMDQIIDTANEFKKTFYAITLIKNTLASERVTAAKKITLIEQAINNIK